jgi:hypothetical protein
MKLSKFTLSDGDEVFEGYTDGTLWNGWSNVCFTREQIIEWLLAGYDITFIEAHTKGNNQDYPIARINWGRESEIIESSPIFVLIDGETHILETYSFEGYEFMEVEE